MARKIHMIGNWKMNQSLEDINQFLSEFKGCSEIEQWFAPQFPHLSYCIEKSKNTSLKVGAQDCSHQTTGAYTGQVSAKTLNEIGTHFVIIGHSERRQYQNEKEDLLNEKIKTALANQLVAVYCVGETLEERENNKTLEIIEEQIVNGLKGLGHQNIIIAYEPVWAIGTGKTASPEQAEEVHKHIRSLLESKLGWPAQEVAILYGGSVKPNNVKDLLACPNIDGGLVGGASLKASDFNDLTP